MFSIRHLLAKLGMEDGAASPSGQKLQKEPLKQLLLLLLLLLLAGFMSVRVVHCA